MPDTNENPEARTESQSKTAIEHNVPATPSAQTSPTHDEAAETPRIPIPIVKVARDAEGDPLPVPGPAILRPTKTVDCNMMSYADGGGVTRQIYMPKGTARLAGALLTAGRFSDLAKFPAWDNQTYDDWEADEEKYAYLNDELGEPAS